ncbi:MAG: ImmA/IrrE family metallo-endopeptidase [Bacillota bacterium]|nr:ImmA/IrrE family metallo-endopeptidase [Bacillota bacterium]
MDWIDNYIYGLLDLYNTNDIYELFDNLGIKIIRLEASNILLRNNDAFYHRHYLGNEIVFIRNDLNLDFEKFVLAHELGHGIIHTHIYTAAFNKSLINVGKLEKQANYFAFKLLNINLDSIDFEGFTIDQVACSLNLPVSYLNQLVY